ncbi:NAD(+)/NADH kinase [soil metagenome]
MNDSGLPIIGIIANPASGKDIRRLVAHGSTFDNNEKINIIRRILIALGHLGGPIIWYMPDTYGIVPRALEHARTAVEAHEIPMALLGNSTDSTEAAMHLRDMSATCIVTLGGDGTNRVVAKGCGNVPLVAISTGTNNVFPRMIEGTIAGIAAAAVARGVAHSAIGRSPRLEILIDDELADIALVDLVVSHQPWIGSRAVWQAEYIKEVVLSHIPEIAIGISAIGPILIEPANRKERGLHAVLGPGGKTVLCPIAPGLLTELQVTGSSALDFGSRIQLNASKGTLALDGEREIELHGDERVEVQLTNAGPRVVNIEMAVAAAIEAGMFAIT